MSKELDDLLAKMREARANWEKSKETYSRVRNTHTANKVIGTADYKIAEYNASKDPKIVKAIGDCTYYRSETQAYAAMISALKAAEWA